MRKLLLKWLGIDNLNNRINSLEGFKHITELRDNYLTNLGEKVNCIYDQIKINPKTVFKKYKYYEYKKIPAYVKDLFDDIYKVSYDILGNDVAVFSNTKFVGYTQECLGEILDRINEVSND